MCMVCTNTPGTGYRAPLAVTIAPRGQDAKTPRRKGRRVTTNSKEDIRIVPPSLPSWRLGVLASWRCFSVAFVALILALNLTLNSVASAQTVRAQITQSVLNYKTVQPGQQAVVGVVVE